MVDILVITHSYELTKEIIRFSEIFKTSDFNILNGTEKSEEFGSSLKYVLETIKKSNNKNGILIFVDLGSSIDIAVNAKKMLKEEINIEIANAPILEGLISAVAANDEDLNLKELKKIAEDSINFRKVK